MAGRLVVQVVHGGEDLPHLLDLLIPSLSRSTTSEIELWALDYSSGIHRELPTSFDRVTVHWFGQIRDGDCGFAENHNFLFQARGTNDDFVILNPDCILTNGSIDRLVATKIKCARAAIVEGRQWPFEHPKEVDPLTNETPWASGAFALIDGRFYAECGGMDEGYFMYLEDVDLSWRAWLSGHSVVYESRAVVAHFSGGQFYRPDVISMEEHYGLRNFLRLAYKFFGEEGERRAIDLLEENGGVRGASQAIADYKALLKENVTPIAGNVSHPRVKILGVNRFHQLRLSLIPE